MSYFKKQLKQNYFIDYVSQYFGGGVGVEF